MQQEQFLNVIDRDEAERRYHAVLSLCALGEESVPLAAALGRVLARDVTAPVDVPGFDRSNVDGFAVHAADTFGADEEHPRRLVLNVEQLAAGQIPNASTAAGSATAIATGAVLPRGADAVVMVEHTDTDGRQLIVRRAVTPGANVTFAGTDIGRGETVLRRGETLTSRDTGVLAALGLANVAVVRKPRVAILSTGDELLEPGQPLRPGLIFDSNATILADAVRELGGEPVPLGIVPDDAKLLQERLRTALQYDIVLLSGGTSKGPGDVSYRVVNDLGPPGIVVHGVALKPGKPICLAAVRVTETARVVPVIILPGFPTSAIFTFHEFVAPIILKLADRTRQPARSISARLAMRVNSERGRTEYLLVGLVSSGEKNEQLIAYPMGKGSGSVTTFSKADGFITISRQREYMEAHDEVEVRLLGDGLQPADLVVIGSHCVGLDYLLGELQCQGIRSKFLAVGSMGGLAAVRRGECDLAGIHLFDPKSGRYNESFLDADLHLIPGYRRVQGIAHRTGDARFAACDVAQAVRNAVADPNCVLINRNRGSGTRILMDGLLGEARPPGYATEAKSHNAVAAAIVQGRADWGLCIETVARDLGLVFIPHQEECYDFVVHRDRASRAAVAAFRQLLALPAIRARLEQLGFRL